MSTVRYLSHGATVRQNYPIPGSIRSGYASSGEEHVARVFEGTEFTVASGHGHHFPSGWRYYDLILSYQDFEGQRCYVLVEVDGSQHFEPSFGRVGALDRLNTCQQRDIHKVRAALKWGVPILHIHHRDLYSLDVVAVIRHLVMTGSNVALSRESEYEHILKGLTIW
jgi:hypothetical protein